MAVLTGPAPTRRPATLLSGLQPHDPIAPLAWLIVPLPLWWLLGMASLGWFIAAVPMAVSLLARRDLRLPPACGWWLLFLLWLLLSVSMLGVDPAGTVREAASARVLAVVFRLAEYGAATVMMLWALNVDPVRVPAVRLARLLALMLVWTLAGGLLGVLAPTFQVTSVVETLLPAGLLDNSYVAAMVHPAAAQVQDVIGTDDGRPSAPFPFTNSWGNAVGLLVPWAIAAGALAATRAGRWWWLGLTAVAVVPAVLSLNRGLWIGLAVLAAFGLVRLLTTGRPLVAVGATCAAAVGAVLLVMTPLGQVAQERQTTEAPSNDIRGFSIARAVEVTTESPVLGFGGTRAQVGSVETIAVGKSPACKNCGNLPLGTNGQLWFAMVGQGLVGAFLYTMFHLALIRRFLRSRGAIPTAGAATMVVALWFSLVYDRTGPTGCLELLAVGIAAKALVEARRPATDPDDPDGTEGTDADADAAVGVGTAP